MKSATDSVKYSQPLIGDYLREDKLEAENSVIVYSRPTTLEKERDGAKVGKHL